MSFCKETEIETKLDNNKFKDQCMKIVLSNTMTSSMIQHELKYQISEPIESLYDYLYINGYTDCQFVFNMKKNQVYVYSKKKQEMLVLTYFPLLIHSNAIKKTDKVDNGVGDKEWITWK